MLNEEYINNAIKINLLTHYSAINTSITIRHRRTYYLYDTMTLYNGLYEKNFILER